MVEDAVVVVVILISDYLVKTLVARWNIGHLTAARRGLIVYQSWLLMIRLASSTSTLIVGDVSIEMTVVTTTFLGLTGFKVQLGTFAWVCLVTRMLKADWNMIIASAISWNLISSQFPLSSVVLHLVTADGLSEIS